MKQAVARIEPDVRRLRLLAAPDTDEVIARSCDHKRAYGARCARLVAQRRRLQGEPVSPYRCFYCGQWHVGRPPSLEGLRRIAEAIRDLHGNRPLASGRGWEVRASRRLSNPSSRATVDRLYERLVRR